MNFYLNTGIVLPTSRDHESIWWSILGEKLSSKARIGFYARAAKLVLRLGIKKARYMYRASHRVDRTTQLSNQIVKDFKAIADLTYLLPIMEGEKGLNETRYKEQ